VKDSTIETLKIMAMMPIGFLLATFVIAPLVTLMIVGPIILIMMAFHINMGLGLITLIAVVTLLCAAISAGWLKA
jgi:hypothetical protein